MNQTTTNTLNDNLTTPQLNALLDTQDDLDGILTDEQLITLSTMSGRGWRKPTTVYAWLGVINFLYDFKTPEFMQDDIKQAIKAG